MRDTDVMQLTSDALPRVTMQGMDAAQAVAEVQHLRTLEQVFRWALRRDPRFTPGDVVIQDEYTHDVSFLAPDGSALVWDTT